MDLWLNEILIYIKMDDTIKIVHEGKSYTGSVKGFLASRFILLKLDRIACEDGLLVIYAKNA